MTMLSKADWDKASVLSVLCAHKLSLSTRLACCDPNATLRFRTQRASASNFAPDLLQVTGSDRTTFSVVVSVQIIYTEGMIVRPAATATILALLRRAAAVTSLRFLLSHIEYPVKSEILCEATVLFVANVARNTALNS